MDWMDLIAGVRVVEESGREHECRKVGLLLAPQTQHSNWTRDNPFVCGQRGAQERQTGGTDEECCKIFKS